MSAVGTITFLNVSEMYTEEEIKLVDTAVDVNVHYDDNVYFNEDIYNNTYTNEYDVELVRRAVNKFSECLENMSTVVDKSVVERYKALTKKINDHYDKAVDAKICNYRIEVYTLD